MTLQKAAFEQADPSPLPGKEGDLPFRISVWAMNIILVLRSPANLVVLGWFTETYRDTNAASEVSHRFHEVAFGVFFTLALVGAISQLLNARRNLAGLAQLTITLVTLAFMVTWTLGVDYWLFLFLVPLAGILWFHGPIRPIRDGSTRLWSVFLLALATPAFLSEIVSNASSAMRGAQNHTTHWSVMAAFYVVLLSLGLVCTMRVRGFRLVGWSLGLAAILLGAAAYAFPYDASSHRREFAVFLVVWGISWIAGTAFSGPKRDRSPLRNALVIAASVIAIPFVLMFSAILVPLLDTPPNVPHRPNPNIPEMTAADVDRGTCLNCHASGVVGAPVVPHESSRTCDGDEPCWGGRSDCAGCHRIDPALGGPTEQIFTGLPGPVVHLMPTAVASAQALSASEIRLLSDLGDKR
jgi:hypothetical protein